MKKFVEWLTEPTWSMLTGIALMWVTPMLNPLTFWGFAGAFAIVVMVHLVSAAFLHWARSK